MKCESCGKTVTRKSNFCPSCGEPIVYRRSAERAPQRRSVPFSYAIALVTAGAFLGFLIFKLSSGPSAPPVATSNAGTFQTASAVPAALVPQVREIADQFMCQCGGCSDPLNECSCDMKNGAREMKGFIAQQLQAGVEKSQIVAMVSLRYGGLKSANAPVVDFKKLQ